MEKLPRSSLKTLQVNLKQGPFECKNGRFASSFSPLRHLNIEICRILVISREFIGQVCRAFKELSWAFDDFLRKTQDLHRQNLPKIRIMMIHTCSHFWSPGWRLSMAVGTSHYIRPRIITHRNLPRVLVCNKTKNYIK